MSTTEPPVKIPVVENEAQFVLTRRRMSYEEYLAWADEDKHAEWVNGEVTVEMPPKHLHQLLVGFLYHIIDLYVRILELGQVWDAPFEVKLWHDGPSREPDLLFLAKEHLDRLTPERIVGAPDLIVEIVSDDSAHRDRVDKLDEYETAGVAEYWIIDNRPSQHRAWFYQLDEQKHYQLIPVGADGIYRSRVLPGLWLRETWLWQEQPNELTALAEIIGPERFAEALRQALK